MRFGSQNNVNLVAMGDSQTAERSALGGARLDQTYPLVAAKAKGYGAVTNLGISGNTTSQMLARLPEAQAHQPGAASIMGFVNNLTTNISGGVWVGGGISPAQTKSELRAYVVAMILQRCRVTLLTGIPVFQSVYLDNAGLFLAAIREIPGETGCEFIDTYANFLAMDTTTRAQFMLDDQHENAAGHALIASWGTGNRFGQF